MSAHTPTPWSVKDAGAPDAWRKPGEYEAKDFALIAGNGICPGIVWDYLDEGKANAAFIVRACNSHDALIAALEKAEAALRGASLELKRAAEQIDSLGDRTGPASVQHENAHHYECQALDAAAALKAAKGEA